MRTRIALLFLALTLSALGCRSARIETGLKLPAEPTATVQAGVPTPTARPMPAALRLAYVQGGDIWVRDLPDGEPQRLTQDGRNDTPLWSPTGEWLAFCKGRPAEQVLWLIRSSGADAHQLAPVDCEARVAWSAVRDRLAYVTHGGVNLKVVDAGLPDAHGVPSRVVGEIGATRIGTPAWSPDGQWLAFDLLAGVTQDDPGIQGIYRARADGSELEKVYLSPDPATVQVHLAGWSPDGRFVLFWQRMARPGSRYQEGEPLMRVPLEGGEPVEIISGMLAYPDFIAWSPDGGSLALTAGSYHATWDDKQIAVVPLGGSRGDLSQEGRADLYPAWSPDGRWLALTSGPAFDEGKSPGGPNPLGERRIWVVAADGSSRRQLTDDANYRDERPRWSCDGQYIIFARLRGEQAQLWLIRPDGSGLQRIVDELSAIPRKLDIFGYVDWRVFYDLWPDCPAVDQGYASVTTPSPAAVRQPGAEPPDVPVQPAPTTAVTVEPGRGPEAVDVVAHFLDEQQRSGAALETALMELELALAPVGLQAQALAVPPRGPGELPMVLVAHRPAGEPVMQGQAVFWWQEGELHQQEFPPESGPRGSDSEAFGRDAVFVDARQRLQDGELELGLVYDANSGGSAPVQVYRLLRLEEGRWRTLWDGLRDGAGQWKTSQTVASLRWDGKLDMVTVRSSSWQVDDSKSGFFHESNPGPHRYFVDTWVRQGDRYELAKSQVEPSAYATLVEFVYHLSRNEDAQAAQLVADPALVARARALGLGVKPAAPGWLIELESPEVEQRGPIQVVDGPPVTVFFEERAGEWLIKDIVETPK